jgi:hypothetical protein
MALDRLCQLELLITGGLNLEKEPKSTEITELQSSKDVKPIEDDVSSTDTLHTGIYISFKEAII